MIFRGARISSLLLTARYPAFPAISGLLAFLAYIGIAWFVLPRQAFWSPDEGAKLMQLENIHFEEGALTDTIAYPGLEIDPELEFTRADSLTPLLHVANHALHFQRLPLFPLLALPLFRWFGFYGLYLIPAIGGAMSGMLALQILEPHDRRLGMWLVIAFASPILIYATIFWEHTLATSLALAGAWLVLRLEPLRRTSPFRKVVAWVVVGCMLGLSMYVRQEVAVFAVALLAAYSLIVRDGLRGPMWAGGALGLLMLLYVPLNQAMLGQKLPDNALYLFYPFTYLQRAGWRVIPDLLVGPFEELAPDPGWVGWVWAIVAVVTFILSFSLCDSALKRNLLIFGLGITAIASAVFLFNPLLYRSAHGLLFTTPWALLGLCRAGQVWQQGGQRAQIIVLTAILGLIGYIVGIVGLRASSPQGGLEWGARFAMIFYPFLAIMALWDLGEQQRSLKMLAVTGTLVLLGFGFQVRGVMTLYHDKQNSATLNEALIRTPEQYVVSDIWWMPLNAAPIYPQKAIFVVPNPKRLTDWIRQAAAHRIKKFCIVTWDPTLLDNAVLLLDRQKLNVLDVRRVEHLLIFRVALED